MKLLTDVVKFGNNFSTLTTIGQLATVGILLYIAFVVGTCTNPPKDDDGLQVTIEQTKEYAQKLADSVENLRDVVVQKETTITTLKVEITRREQQQAASRARINVLETRAAQERRDLAIVAPITDTLITVMQEQLLLADEIIAGKDSVIELREEQVELLTYALDVSVARGDTLQQTLDAVLKKHQKKNKLFGKIPLPSRTAVATVAFVGGTIVGARAVR
jgi:hypothetical protein